MAWRMRAKVLESCSCAMPCRCTLGPAQPDQGWCSGAIAVQVMEGESGGIDLGGAKVVLLADLPGDFLGGIDNAKLVLDSGLSDDQRAELDAIFRGERGGIWEGMREAIANWLPTEVAQIDVAADDSRVTISGSGEIVLNPILTEDGKRASLHNAPVAAGGFGQHTLELAHAGGTKMAPDGLRSWESMGYGATSTVEWGG